MDGVVLVLNQNYEPLNVCNLPRAFRLVFGEKAEVIEYDHQVIRTPRTEYRAPSVIRLQHLIRRPRPRVKLSRREVFARDRHTCQYCGRQAHDLTLDHVVPRHRGGGHTWENLVDGVQAVQPPQGRQDARGGAAAAASGRRSSRAATSTRCSRRTSPTSATRRGGRTCSWGGTDRVRPRRGASGRRSRRPSRDLLETLWAAGHAAYVVGGSLRDVAPRPAGRPTGTSRPTPGPSGSSSCFPDAVYENRFGTVAVRRDGEVFEITTFRSDHDYADFRRPHRVEFGDTIELDLARRDFTVNAMAWGATAAATPPAARPTWSTRTAGAADVAAGDPAGRRRPAAPVRGGRAPDGPGRPARGDARVRGRGRRPWPGSRRGPSSSRHLSGERIAAELDKLLAAPSAVGRAAAAGDTGLLARDLAGARRPARHPAEQGPGRGPLGPHAADGGRGAGRRGRSSGWRPCSTTSASRRRSPTATSSATTRSGAELAGAFLDRLRSPRSVRERVVHLVRHHMFSYEPNWSDAAVRRFIAKMAAIGDGALDELFDLREADNVGSGLPADAGRLDELRARVAAAAAPRASCSTGATSPSTATT